jgi:hypothetical protein
MNKMETAFALFDAYNRQDPHRLYREGDGPVEGGPVKDGPVKKGPVGDELVEGGPAKDGLADELPVKEGPVKGSWNEREEGAGTPAEYFYARQLHRWVLKLQPDAGEALLLASRCQHIGRWEIPRSTYPPGKAGYFAWRTGLSKYHAEKAGQLLEEAGYDYGIRTQVQSLLLKEGLRTNPDMQIMENALCLVFLEYQYEDFLLLHPEEKIIRILKKTWAKMSQPGREAALGLSFSERGEELIRVALGE